MSKLDGFKRGDRVVLIHSDNEHSGYGTVAGPARARDFVYVQWDSGSFTSLAPSALKHVGGKVGVNSIVDIPVAKPMNTRDIRVGDVLTLRCGGKVTVRWLELQHQSSRFNVHLKIEGYHVSPDYWSYDMGGSHGNGTGPVDEFPFDIVKVHRASALMLMEAK